MTKRMFVLSFAVLALFAVASMAVAQPPQGGRGQGGFGGGPMGGGMMMGGGGAMGILMNEDARTELGITEEQGQKLREAGAAMREAFTPPAQGERPDPAQMQAQMQRIQADMRKNLEATLSKEQVGKLDVMVFQRSGGLESPMVNAESLRALNLTDDQKAKLQAAQEKRMQAMMAARPAENFDFRTASQEERQAQMAKMREVGEKANEAFQAELKGVLSKEQVAKAEELMKNVPEYLQQRGPGQGQGQGQRNRGNLDGWQPGQGGPREANPNREERGNRGNRTGGGRQFPG